MRAAFLICAGFCFNPGFRKIQSIIDAGKDDSRDKLCVLLTVTSNGRRENVERGLDFHTMDSKFFVTLVFTGQSLV